jgi:hypothetical protein
MHNPILPYDPDVSFRQQAFLIPRQIQQDVYGYQPPVPTGLAYDNDAYRLGRSGYDLNYATTESWGTQALHNGDYSMVSVLYQMLGTIAH